MIEKKIRMALIATYPEMSKLFLNIANRRGVIPYDRYASFSDAVDMAKKLEPEVDVFISRGGTATNIHNAVATPVVSVPITPFDVLQAVRKLDAGVREVALFHHTRKIYGVESIQEEYGIRIHEYQFDNMDDITVNIEQVRAHGLGYVIGGQVAVRLARAAGLVGIELNAGEDTVFRAVEEGIRIVTESRRARQQAARLESAFDAIREGVVVTDENRSVIVYNRSAEKILQKKYHAGDSFSDPKLNATISDMERTRQARADRLYKFGPLTVNTSHFPVLRGGNFLGMVSTFSDVTEIQRLEQSIRKQLHEKGFTAKYTFSDIVTCSPKLQESKHLAQMYASTDYAVLIEGESGTGKELFAQSIHNASRRAKGAFVAINCAAIPESLLESELFGYETGAFTGANKEGHSGLFEMANGGTIFLDEIGELPLQLQTRLLRVLQEKEIMRVGGSKIIPVDVRVISATNKGMQWMREGRNFRQDLYYRLNVLNVRIPPLRERREDIEAICEVFYQKNDIHIDKDRLREVLAGLKQYQWPGNVRELQNIAQRIAFLFENSPQADVHDLARMLGLDETMQAPEEMPFADVDVHGGLKSAVAQMERQLIAKVLEECGGDYGKAAERLKIGRTTLWRKLTQREE